MSFWKHVKRMIRGSYNPKTQFKMSTNPKYALGQDKKGTPPPGAPPEDYQGELNTELANYKTIGDQALTGATADAKAAGTYADTAAGRTALQGEADAESRFGKRASLAKINALQGKLGVPQTPAGQL